MTIGRGREAKLTLAHALVSRIHCELYEVDGVLCIRDMGSLNGTYVGDVRVTEAALEAGDILSIGAFKFELIIEEGKPSAPALPDDAGRSDVRLADDQPEPPGEADENEMPPLMPPGSDDVATEVEPDDVEALEPLEDVAPVEDEPPAASATVEAGSADDAVDEEIEEIEEIVDDVPDFADIEEAPEELAEVDDAEEVEEVEAIEEVDDDPVEVESVDEEDEPPPPEAQTIAQPAPEPNSPQPQQPAAKQAKSSGDDDFNFLDAESSDEENQKSGASDADLNDFLKGLG